MNWNESIPHFSKVCLKPLFSLWCLRRNYGINSIFFTPRVSAPLSLNYYSHSRPVSWCPLGIFWGLPAGGPGRRAGGRASSHRCRRTRNRPLSSPPSPSHLPSAWTGARCQDDRRRQAGPTVSVKTPVFNVVCEKQLHATFIKKHTKKTTTPDFFCGSQSADGSQEPIQPTGWHLPFRKLCLGNNTFALHRKWDILLLSRLSTEFPF